MAALGRLTASIAHEIRNPYLLLITQRIAQEETQSQGNQRLLTIIREMLCSWIVWWKFCHLNRRYQAQPKLFWP
jgi:hypothetical protein